MPLYFGVAPGMCPHSSTEREFPGPGLLLDVASAATKEKSGGTFSPLPLRYLFPLRERLSRLAVSMVKVRERESSDGFPGNSKGELVALVMVRHVMQRVSENLTPNPSSHPVQVLPWASQFSNSPGNDDALIGDGLYPGHQTGGLSGCRHTWFGHISSPMGSQLPHL